MKLRFITSLLFFLGATSLLTMAASSNKRIITLYQPTVVNDITLNAGEYTVLWDGTGSEVQVSFLRKKRTVVTAPATLDTTPHSDYATSVAYSTDGKSLLFIQWKDSTLKFNRADAQSD